MMGPARCMVAAASLVAGNAGAQAWRVIDASRQLRDTTAMSVHVDYAAGRVEVKPTAGPSMYEMHMRYDAERSEPVTRYDSAMHALSIGIRSHGMRLTRGNGEGGTLHAELSTRVPMGLSFELGAVEADLQLGGLRLTDVSLKSGAADVTLRFDQPNLDRVRTLALEVVAANTKVVRAGNSGVERVRANIGAGALDLDLSGELTHDVVVSATLGLGSFTLRVPSDMGVTVDASTFLADFEKNGLVKRGDRWYSLGFDEAKRHVRVRVKAFLGEFNLVREVRDAR